VQEEFVRIWAPIVGLRPRSIIF